jgi:hypothetical protein
VVAEHRDKIPAGCPGLAPELSQHSHDLELAVPTVENIPHLNHDSRATGPGVRDGVSHLGEFQCARDGQHVAVEVTNGDEPAAVQLDVCWRVNPGRWAVESDGTAAK